MIYQIDLPPGTRPIQDYPDYCITEDGTVYSRRLTGKWRKRKPRLYPDGYRRIVMCSERGQKTLYVHRLIAQAWVSNPDNKPDVNHIDHVPANNHASNLEWVTHAENLRKAREHWGSWATGHCGKPLIITNAATKEETEWPSARHWAITTGNPHRVGNISKAIRTGRAAYGHYFRFKDPAHLTDKKLSVAS